MGTEEPSGNAEASGVARIARGAGLSSAAGAKADVPSLTSGAGAVGIFCDTDARGSGKAAAGGIAFFVADVGAFARTASASSGATGGSWMIRALGVAGREERAFVVFFALFASAASLPDAAATEASGAGASFAVLGVLGCSVFFAAASSGAALSTGRAEGKTAASAGGSTRRRRTITPGWISRRVTASASPGVKRRRTRCTSSALRELTVLLAGISSSRSAWSRSLVAAPSYVAKSFTFILTSLMQYLFSNWQIKNQESLEMKTSSGTFILCAARSMRSCSCILSPCPGQSVRGSPDQRTDTSLCPRVSDLHPASSLRAGNAYAATGAPSGNAAGMRRTSAQAHVTFSIPLWRQYHLPQRAPGN